MLETIREYALEQLRTTGRLESAHERWPTGMFCIWYPLTDRAGPVRFHRDLARSGIRELIARVRAVLRLIQHCSDPASRCLRYGLLEIDLDGRLDFRDGLIALTDRRLLALAGELGISNAKRPKAVRTIAQLARALAEPVVPIEWTEADELASQAAARMQKIHR